jgi:hypothetical protein
MEDICEHFCADDRWRGNAERAAETRQGSMLRPAGNRLGNPGCNRSLWHRNLAPASTASPRGVERGLSQERGWGAASGWLVLTPRGAKPLDLTHGGQETGADGR